MKPEDRSRREPEAKTSGEEHAHDGEGESNRKVDRLQGWLALAANLGILAGLILVIVEINQNTQLARTTYKSEGNIVSNQIWATVMGSRISDVIAKSASSPGEMTHSDFIALDAYLFPSINLIYRDYQLAQEGLYTEQEWKTSVEAYVHWYLANPFGKAWWNELASEYFPADFVEYVDAQIAQDGRRDHYQYWLDIRAHFEEPEPLNTE